MSENVDRTEKATKEIGKYVGQGYQVLHVFPNEYVLLGKFLSGSLVRVYDEGTVWVKNDMTGEYVKEVS